MSVDHIRRWSERGLAKRWHESAQFAVVVDGALSESAVGASSGGAATTETRYPLTCLTKPIVAFALARAAEDGLIDLTRPVADYVPRFSGPGRDDITLVELLTHTALLDGDPAPADDLSAYSRDQVFRLRRRPSSEPSAAFSAYANWFLLGEALESVTGCEYERYVRSKVFEPMGLESIELAPAGGPSHASRASLDVSSAMGQPHGSSSFPGWFRGTRSWPGISGLGTAADVARFFALTLEVFQGRRPDLLSGAVGSSLVAPWRVGLRDEARGDDLSWGLGFVVDQRLFGRKSSPGVFGHTGFRGSSVAFADPELGLAAAVLYDTAAPGASSMLRLAGTVKALYEDASR